MIYLKTYFYTSHEQVALQKEYESMDPKSAFLTTQTASKQCPHELEVGRIRKKELKRKNKDITYRIFNIMITGKEKVSILKWCRKESM